MRAIQEVDGRLRLVLAPDPVPGPGEALLQVRATALNRADLHQRRGNYPPPPGASEILGLEAAGVVLEGGGDEFPPGSRACALLAGGGYGELVAVPRELLMPVPEGWSWEQAAAFPEVFFTAYLNLFVEGGLVEGERFLVHAGASGVGTAAIQLAARAGCRVYATAGSDEKVRACIEAGANFAVNHREGDFAEVLRDQTDGAGVDLILDVVGGPYLERNLGLLATGGRLVVIATLGGREARIDLGKLMRKRALLRGSTLRARPVAEKARLKQGLWERFGEEFRSGAITPRIDSVFAAEEAEEAHARMAANLNIGKIVLRFGA